MMRKYALQFMHHRQLLFSSSVVYCWVTRMSVFVFFMNREEVDVQIVAILVNVVYVNHIMHSTKPELGEYNL